MNYLIIIIICWIVIDIFRYIKYTQTYHRLNRGDDKRDTNEKNIRKMLDDLKNHPDIFESLILDIFLNRIRLEDMNRDEVCDALFEMIGENENYREEIGKLVKRFQIIKRKEGIKIFTNNSHHKKRLRYQKHELVSWFNILPIYLLTQIVRIIVSIYMHIIRYKSYKINHNGLKIWYTQFDPNKGTPLVFFHPSVGGVSLQFTILNHLRKNYNIIMPEIPGIAFIDNYDKPPSLSEIINNVHDFILTKYFETHNIDESKLKINIMGHSLGCTICGAYINMYPKNINNFFCIEGQIFFPRAFRLIEDFESKIEDIPTEDLITVPLLHRDLYVQYFIFKRVTLDYTMIFDLEEEDMKHIKIHMYHIKNDRRILIRPQLEYALKKNIQITYHLFDGNYSHGSFVLNKTIRNYIINNIRKIYDENNNKIDFIIQTNKCVVE